MEEGGSPASATPYSGVPAGLQASRPLLLHSPLHQKGITAILDILQMMKKGGKKELIWSKYQKTYSWDFNPNN